MKITVIAIMAIAIIGTGTFAATTADAALQPRMQFKCYEWQKPGTCVVIPTPTVPVGPTTGTK